MSKEEVVRVLAILQTAYPMFYRGQTPDQARNTANLWLTMFEDKSYDVVMAAVKALIATRTDTFPPNIGAVNDMIVKMTTTNQLSEPEAWGCVLKAISNGIYHSREEWEKLPEEVRECISPESIRELAMSANFNAGVESSNFLRTYRARQRARCERQMLTADIRNLVEQANQRMLEQHE